MVQQRLNKLKELMRINETKCLILVPGVDQFYATGIITHPSERLLAAIIPLEEEPIIICPSFEESRIQKSLETGKIRTWDEEQNPFKLLGKTVKELGLETEKIALDNKLWFEWFLRIKEVLPKVQFTDSKKIIQAARLIKSEQEIAKMKTASKIAAEAIIKAHQEAAPGMTETEISEIVQKGLKKGGGRVAFCLVQSGSNSSFPHGSPTGRAIQQNDVLLIDAGPFYEGYIGDITITSVIGEPSDKFLKVYDIVYQGNRKAIEFLKAGVKAEEADKIAREVIKQAGFGDYFTHRLGHGLGLEAHEPPYIVKGNELILQSGMCHSVEPGIYLPNEFGIRIEDNIVIREDHAEFLYKVPRRIWEER
ncbi:MAG: M24 family metallopeptidase [Candidatus Heimdallarchaeota archaeon]|nr:M24 family metallopeptidase [Candidatus Heimdallarchaeota archaeon]